MRATALAAALLLAASARAAGPGDAFLASEAIQAREVAGPLPADPGDAFWSGLPAVQVAAVPQRTLRLNDRRANEALAAAGPRSLSVRAAHDARDLGVLVEWDDATQDRMRQDATDVYGDAAAMEIPRRFGAGLRLPYVGMGDEGQPVAVSMVRATAQGVVVREAAATGFGSLARADGGGARAAMRYDPARGSWRALFLRPLGTGEGGLARGLIPFALAVWDGSRQERGGNKALTRWKFLRLARYPLEQAYLTEMAWGFGPEGHGDVARGKALVEGMCTPCHTVGERRAPVAGMAPDLSAIGAISTPGYLRDSLLDPSTVVVPSPNPAQHQDRSRAPGVSGPYPLNEGFAWSRRDASGKAVSRMPPYAALPRPDLEAVVSYLMTLGAPAPGERRKP
ncbi:MAG TPA: ethylbenzene dehydrogenase-related protein [Anaeromyxobacteraceae bacterium]|nr:ethylbenzene dehydrogenase-related protein [Anaeromyxobacteraceae bacterium]